MLQALEAKKAAGKLRRAKVNAIRRDQGLPPLRPWYVDCTLNCATWARETCLRAFCPCCIKDPKLRARIFDGKTWYSRICIDGSHENDMLKSCLGFLGGMVLTFLWFLIMVYQLEYSPPASFVTCLLLGAVLTIGLAFSDAVRCMTLITIPGIFSSTGRNILLGVLLVLVLGGPMENFSHNVQVMAETSACGQQVAYNATQNLVDTATAPISSIVDTLQLTLNGIIELVSKLKNAFQNVQDLFSEILAAVERVFDWLDSIVNMCDDTMSSPYNRCMNVFNDAEQKCRDVMPVGFLCDIVGAISAVCNIARVTEVICTITQCIADFVGETISSNIDFAMSDLYDMFYFNVTLDYHYSLSVNSSQTWDDVRESIQSEIESRLVLFDWAQDWSRYALLFTMTWLVVKALLYKHGFLTKDRYDNQYITSSLETLEEKRASKGKETLLPLTWQEQEKYINANSLRLAKSERKKMIIGLVLLSASLLNCGFYLALDYGLYWLLTMIREHGDLTVTSSTSGHLQLHVEGEGVLSDIYRALITQFDSMGQSPTYIDTTNCLPNPQCPDLNTYRIIGTLCLICIFLVLFESYGLRIRHIVAGCYYPVREKERAVWLYNHILRRRGGFVKFLRRKLRDKSENEAESKKVSVLQRLAAVSPRLGKILRTFGLVQNTQHCLACGISETGEEDFIHCDNKCNAAYCQECFADIQNVCTVCMNPVEYGDFSDISEEVDSSGEDEESVTDTTKDERKMKIFLAGMGYHGEIPQNVRQLLQGKNVPPGDLQRQTVGHPTSDRGRSDAQTTLLDHSIDRRKMTSSIIFSATTNYNKPQDLASLASFDDSDEGDYLDYSDEESMWDETPYGGEIVTSEKQMLMSRHFR